jgi:hypothetical protein
MPLTYVKAIFCYEHGEIRKKVKPEVTDDYNKIYVRCEQCSTLLSILQKNRKMDQGIYAVCYRWPP